MKKRAFTLVLACAMVLCLVLSACDKTKPPAPTVPGTTEPTAAPTAVPEVRGVDVPEGRYDAKATPRTGNNATRPLVLQDYHMDGKFSPFFATSAYDVNTVGWTQLGLFDTTKDGEMIAGIEYASIAYSYEVKAADDSSSSTYKIWIKNGLVWPDGSPITMDDILFTTYTYLDPLYDGSSTLYALDIKGLPAYRAQISEDAYTTLTAKIEKLSAFDPEKTYVEGDYFYYLPEAGAQFAGDIVNYVADKYSAKYSGMISDKPFAEFTDGEKIALGMALWGFGEPSEEDPTKFIGAGTETEYDIDALTLDDYWTELYAAYEGDIADISDTEAAGELGLAEMLTPIFYARAGASMGGAIPASVSGITTGKEVMADGQTRDFIQFVLNGVSPTAIFQLSYAICPWEYYTKGYAGTLNENHVAVADPDFIQTLKDKNDMPVGAGPYIFESFIDNVITYTANDSFLLGSPKIATLRVKIVENGSEMDSLRVGDTDFSNPSPTTQLVSDLSAKEGDYANLSFTLVDNDGYGYIGINGQLWPDLSVRQAIARSFNTELTITNYYGELASVNFRTMTKILWAYPDNPENLFPYDETGEATKAGFLAAGFTYDEAKKVMLYPENYSEKYPHLADKELDGKPVVIKATLPMAAEEHPAGSVFLEAKNLLATIGITLNIEVDTGVLNKLNTAFESGIEIWAAAWGSGGVDPDMFQVWYSDPAVNSATSPTAKGLYWLYNNGSDDQKAMLVRLNELIMQGKTLLDPEQRKPIYKEALEIATSLACEVPTYQRKNIFVYNDEVINIATLIQPENVTPFWSPLQHVWEVELNG